MTEKKKSLTPGIVMILIGLWYLMRRTIFIDPYWKQVYPFILILWAVFLIIETIRRHQSGTLFWGSTILFVGLFFLVRNYGIIDFYSAEEYWPIFLLALGCGFVASFIFHPDDWGLLIPASLCIFFGIGFSLQTLHGLFWRWEFIIDNIGQSF